MGQFLPLYELSEDDYRVIARTFARVFPNSTVFFTGYDTILLGVAGDAPLNLAAVRASLTQPAVAQSLAEIGVHRVEDVLSMFVTRASDSPRLAGAGPLNTDANARIEFSAPRSAVRFTADRNQAALLELFGELPPEWVAGLSADERARAARARDALRSALQAAVRRLGGHDLPGAVALLRDAARVAPESAVVRNELVAALTASAMQEIAGGSTRKAFLELQVALAMRLEG